MRSFRFLAFAFAALAVAACAEAPTGPANSALNAPEVRLAHESNNQASLTGSQNGNTITGNAIINYVAGTEGWQSSVSLQGDLAEGTYTFFALGGPGGVQAVCSFTIDENGGRQGCSADTDLGGFVRAEVRDEDGIVVASGIFERRGGTREVKKN
ncbi:MAG: hypothetical protein H0U13_08045 [Gemmatimonadaceae bacterium]|nr:hypothetical protein [Gemmatimonadaceae bacterium]